MSFAAFEEHGSYEVVEEAISSGHRNVLIRGDSLENSRNWEVRHVHIDPVVAMKISLNVLGGNVRFDSLRVTRGECQKPLTCDFRNWKKCGFDFLHHKWRFGVTADPAGSSWYIGNGRL